MTTRKKGATRKAEARKLRIKKETIRDLDVKSKAREVKGGVKHACHVDEGSQAF